MTEKIALAIDVPGRVCYVTKIISTEKYQKGALGALPDPDLISSLLDIKGNVSKVRADE